MSLRLGEEGKYFTPAEVLFREIAEITGELQSVDSKYRSGRERRRKSNLIKEKRKKLEQLLIDQGLLRLQNSTK